MFGGVGVTFVTGAVTTEAMKKVNEIKRVTNVTNVIMDFVTVYARSPSAERQSLQKRCIEFLFLMVTVVTLVTALF